MLCFWKCCHIKRKGAHFKIYAAAPSRSHLQCQAGGLMAGWRRIHTKAEAQMRLVSWGACMLSCFSCVRLFATLQTVAHQAPPSMRFSRQEYWSGLPCPPPGDLPDAGIKPASLVSPALAGGFCTINATREVPCLDETRPKMSRGLYLRRRVEHGCVVYQYLMPWRNR